MADILFIMPRIGYMDSRRSHPAVPLSILSAANLVSREFGVKILDMRISNSFEEELKTELLKKPLLVASTCWTGPMIRDVVRVARFVKRYGDIPVVLGGVHPTLLPEQTVLSPFVDFVITGEGEESLLKLARVLKNGGSIGDVPNLCYKKDGKAVSTFRSDFLKLDELPELPYHLIEVTKYLPLYQGRRSISIESSRGCPFRCRYCYQGPFNRQQIRFVSADKVVKSVINLRDRYGVEDFYFIDDNFYIDMERGKEIALGLQGRGVTYQIQGVDILSLSKMSDEYFSLLERSGLRRLTIGIETGSPRLREYLGKKGDVETIIEVVKRLSKHNIIIYCSFFGGYPEETVEDVRMSIDLMLRLIGLNPNFRTSPYYIYIPFPGTRMYEEIVKAGRFREPKTFEEWGDFSWEDNPYIRTLGREKAELYRRLYLLTLFADDKYREYEYSSLRKAAASLYHRIAYLRLKHFWLRYMPEMLLYKNLFGAE